MIKKYFFVLLLFFSFFLGYFSLYWFVPIPLVQVPELVGKTLSEGFALAAERSMGLHLIKEVDDQTYVDQMIIEQYPLAGTSIKVHENCFVSVVRHKKKQVPRVTDLLLQEARSLIEKEGYHLQQVSYPFLGLQKEKVIAQFEKQDHMKKEIICFVSLDTKGAFLMPDIKGRTLAEIKKTFEQYQWQFDLILKDDHGAQALNEEHIIIDQRPIAGALCQEVHGLFVQCLVHHV